MARWVKHFLLLFWSVIRHNDWPKHLFYHDIGTTHTPMGTAEELFWSHMKVLSKCGVAHRVCFDDGFRGLWDCREKLRAMGVKPTVFVAIALVGRPGYLTWDEIRTLQNEYGVDFQCHTWTHQTLAGRWTKETPYEPRTDAWYQHELVESKAEMERQLNKNVMSLCFPVGYFSDDVIRRCKEAGYAFVFASYPGNASNDFVQPRCSCQDLSVFEFRCVLNGGMNPLKAHYLKLHFAG